MVKRVKFREMILNDENSKTILDDEIGKDVAPGYKNMIMADHICAYLYSPPFNENSSVNNNMDYRSVLCQLIVQRVSFRSEEEYTVSGFKYRDEEAVNDLYRFSKLGGFLTLSKAKSWTFMNCTLPRKKWGSWVILGLVARLTKILHEDFPGNLKKVEKGVNKAITLTQRVIKDASEKMNYREGQKNKTLIKFIPSLNYKHDSISRMLKNKQNSMSIYYALNEFLMENPMAPLSLIHDYVYKNIDLLNKKIMNFNKFIKNKMLFGEVGNSYYPNCDEVGELYLRDTEIYLTSIQSLFSDNIKTKENKDKSVVEIKAGKNYYENIKKYQIVKYRNAKNYFGDSNYHIVE